MTSSRALASLALVALVFAAYSGVGELGYVDFDDGTYVHGNEAVRSGLAGWRYAFTSTKLGNWHPLTWLSHMAVVSGFGLEPAAHHWANVGLHAVATLLAFAWLVSATGRSALAFTVAALFAVHPLRVESVAWIAERKDVLSGVFFFTSLWAWTRFTRAPVRRRYWLAWGAFALGLLAKPMLVTLPVVLLIVDRWPLRRSAPWTALVAEKLPFFLTSAAFAVLAFVSQLRSEAVGDLESYGVADRAVNALHGLGFYVDRTLWPRDLAVFYPVDADPSPVVTLALLAGVLAISVAAFRAREREPHVAAGWAWFLVTVAPVIGLVQIGLQAHADRYAYLPQVGLLVLGVWSLARTPATVATPLAVLVIGACTWLTRQQVEVWRSDEALFGHAAEVTDDNYFALVKLGQVRSRQGRAEEAVELYERALELEPEYAIGHNNIGTELYGLGRVREAVEHFEEAIRIRPVNFEPLANLAAAWWTLGDAERADEYARRALEIRPDEASLRRYLRDS